MIKIIKRYLEKKRRERLIIAALSGIMANPGCSPTSENHFDNIAQDAIEAADTVLRAI